MAVHGTTTFTPSNYNTRTTHLITPLLCFTEYQNLAAIHLPPENAGQPRVLLMLPHNLNGLGNVVVGLQI